MSDTPAVPGTPRLMRGVDRVLAVQRPVVLAQLRQLRRSRPEASPAELLRIVERRYLAAVTTGGAAVGAAASFPSVGTGASIALSGVETVGFMEATALFTQSVAELHGIAVDDPDRARTLVMTMILGNGGRELLEQLVAQAAGRGASRNLYWGELVAKSLPGPTVGLVADRLKQAFLKRFAVTQGGSALGRAIPFGVGAVIGGTGNHILGRRVLASARTAFGPVPETFSPDLDAYARAPREPRPPLLLRAGRRRIPLPVIPLPVVRRRLEQRRPKALRERPTPPLEAPADPRPPAA